MKILVACEESQAVCKAFRMQGHEAYSCDIQEPSGGYPEWHFKQSVTRVLNGGHVYTTMTGEKVDMIYDTWDMIIAFPPCTYLSNAGEKYFNIGRYGYNAIDRMYERSEAAYFFMTMINAKCDKIAVENPVGYMNTHYRKPDQIISPHQFGHNEMKRTCLWLKNLPLLVPTNVIENPVPTKDAEWFQKGIRKDRAKNRSKTFPGIVEAMAKQ